MREIDNRLGSAPAAPVGPPLAAMQVDVKSRSRRLGRPLRVMAALGAATRDFSAGTARMWEVVGARDKPGHDDRRSTSSAHID
jgi:hypothetical protein